MLSLPAASNLFKQVPVKICLAEHQQQLQLLRLEDVQPLLAAHCEEALPKLPEGFLHRVAEGVLDVGGDKLLPGKTQRWGRVTSGGSTV